MQDTDRNLLMKPNATITFKVAIQEVPIFSQDFYQDLRN